MSLRRTMATFLLLPVITMLEAAAWYGAHSVLFLFRIEDVEWGGLGMTTDEAMAASGTARLLIPLAMLLGGGLAAAMGSQGLLVLGLVLTVPGMALLGAPMPWVAGLAAALLVLGHGLTRPGLMGTAAATLRGRSEHLRTALVALVYAAINIGAILGPACAPAVQTQLGYGPLFMACAALMLVALVAAALLGGATLLTCKEVAAKPEPTPGNGKLLLGAAGLGALVFLPWIGMLQSWELAWRIFDASPLPPPFEHLWTMANPLACLFTGVSVATVAGGLHLAKLRAPAPFAMALGLLMLALGQALILVTGTTGSPWPALLGLVVAGMGEAVLMVFLISRMLGDLHWRLVALVMAVWLGLSDAGTQLLSWLGGTLELEWWFEAVGWTSVGSAVLAALVLAALAIPAQRKLWTADQASS